MKDSLRLVAGLVFALVLAVQAVPPAELDYQGKVLVSDLPFTGSGCFKFAIADEDDALNYWANDGTAVGEPTGVITNAVVNGVFSTVLGAAPMSPMDPAIFSVDTDLYLRVWFSPTNTGFVEMRPAQKVVSAPYALNAGLVGGLTATEIENNSVAAATNAITLAGDVTGLPQNNTLGGGVVYDANVNAAANIDGTKVAQGTTSARGTLQLATGSTGAQAIATGHPVLNSYGRVNTLAATAPNSTLLLFGNSPVYVSNQAPNLVQIGLSSLPATSLALLSNVIWVATNGTSVGPGTIDKPYDSPQNGYNAAASKFVGQPATLAIAAGTYGSLTMSADNVHVIGFNRPVLDTLFVQATAHYTLYGKQRVENLVTVGPVIVLGTGGEVKLHNLNIWGGLIVNGSDVEVQHCHIKSSQMGVAAAAVGSGEEISNIGFYHSCIEQTMVVGAAALDVNQNVFNFEVLWCELVNPTAACIYDRQVSQIQPVHLYAQNYINGPPPSAGIWTVYDAATSTTIGFFNNTVMGHVGLASGNPPSHLQFFANNIVYGIINYPGSGNFGWTQAGAGTGADAANNTEHETTYPALPNTYRD